MFADGEIFPAERLVRDYLLKHGNHVEAMRLLAKIGMKLEVLDDAEFLLESALVAGARLPRDALRLRAGAAAAAQARPALAELDRLLKIDPQNRAYQITYATACVGVGQQRGGDRALPGDPRPDARDPPICICRSHMP